MKKGELTELQWPILMDMSGHTEWISPMMIGGHNGSCHSRVLMQLAKKGLVEKREWGGWVRGSHRYRITEEGEKAISAYRKRPAPPEGDGGGGE